MKKLIKKNKIYKIYTKIRSILYLRNKQRKLNKVFRSSNPLNIIVGSGNTNYKGWFSTDLPILDITNSRSWARLFSPNSIDRILSEHVFEHLSYLECNKALELSFNYLKDGGSMRVAVPDGYRPDSNYIKEITPPKDGHKIVFNIDTLSELLENHDFNVLPLEYFDLKGKFHFNSWNVEDGMIKRSFRFDNQEDFKFKDLFYTSIVVDAVK